MPPLKLLHSRGKHMHKAINHIAAIVAKYPALYVGMLAGGALISVAERSLSCGKGGEIMTMAIELKP